MSSDTLCFVPDMALHTTDVLIARRCGACELVASRFSTDDSKVCAKSSTSMDLCFAPFRVLLRVDATWLLFSGIFPEADICISQRALCPYMFMSFHPLSLNPSFRKWKMMEQVPVAGGCLSSVMRPPFLFWDRSPTCSLDKALRALRIKIGRLIVQCSAFELDKTSMQLVSATRRVNSPMLSLQRPRPYRRTLINNNPLLTNPSTTSTSAFASPFSANAICSLTRRASTSNSSS